jgi:hypothetical protein
VPRVVLDDSPVHRYRLLQSPRFRQRVAQAEVRLQKGSSIARTIRQLHPLLVVTDTIRGQGDQAISHLRCPDPVLAILVAGKCQRQLFLYAPSVTGCHETVGHCQVHVRVFRIIQNPVLQISERRRYAGLRLAYRECVPVGDLSQAPVRVGIHLRFGRDIQDDVIVRKGDNEISRNIQRAGTKVRGKFPERGPLDALQKGALVRQIGGFLPLNLQRRIQIQRAQPIRAVVFDYQRVDDQILHRLRSRLRVGLE